MPSPEHPTHSISRDSLSRPVRSYDDNLDTQARLLFDKYKLPHYDKDILLAAIEDRTVSLEDARHLRDLLAQRDHIRLTGELPPEAKNSLEYQLQEAREILGPDNVYGPEQVADVFNVDLPLNEIPPILYSHEDLEKAKELGMKLILRISHDHEGLTLTPQHMNDILQPRFDTEERGKLLFQDPATAWFKDESFYTAETPISPTPSSSPSLREGEKITAEWKLVTTDILPNSTNKNYLEQTILLRDTLASHGWLTPEEAEEVTDDKINALQTLLDQDFEKNWKDVAHTMAHLKLTTNHRRTFSQALYDTALVYLTETDPIKRPLERTYDWTQSHSSDGLLVYFGILGSGGAHVVWWLPGFGLSALVSPSPASVELDTWFLVLGRLAFYS